MDEPVTDKSDAEPVAWQYREPDGKWQMCDAATDIYYRTSKYEIRPLYAAPPHLDVLRMNGFKEVVTRDTASIYDNNPQPRLVEEIFDFDRKLIGFRVYDAPDASAGLVEAAEELADLMDDVVRGNYKPDTFTTQPLRKALRARAADRREDK